mgnify:CR=1 FL=1
MSAIYTNIRSPDLFSGSADAFRTAIGGYWYVQTTDEGNSAVEFETTTANSPLYTSLELILADTANATTMDDTIITPNKTYSVRVVGNSDNIKNDEEWRTLWLGGTYGSDEYTALYPQSVLRYYDIAGGLPYAKIQETMLTSDYASSVIEIGYDYDMYMPQYQSTINSYTSELLIPNFYIMKDLMRWDFAATSSTQALYPDELYDFISREGLYENVNDIFEFNNNALPEIAPDWVIEEWGSIRKQNTNLSIEYLTGSSFGQSLSASTITWAESKQKTLLFDYEAIRTLAALDSVEGCLPYKIKIEFPTEESSFFAANIEESKFGSKFIKTLYESFAGNIEELTPTSAAFVESKSYYTGSADEGIDLIETSTNITYREIDYTSLLYYCYYNYVGSDDDCMFIGESTLHRAAAIEPSAMYRHINTVAASEALDYAIEFVANEDNTQMNDWNYLFSNIERHSEVVAYRIEKIGGVATGDSNTQTALQNFWFLNSADMETMKYYDNQIKYNTDYTYKVYAYVLSLGVEYKYADLLLGRDLGCESSDGTKMGIEFYDPSAGDVSTEERYDSSLKPSLFNTNAGGTTYGTKAQIFSKYQYVADLNVIYQPRLKIIEVPLYSKTLRVMDNPSPELNVRPYQVIDSSRQLGFDLVTNSFRETAFPTTISSDDDVYKERYLHANDLLQTSHIVNDSIAEPRYIEIYRLSDRPSGITDFRGNLVKTLDLKIKDEAKYTYTGDFFEDTIKTNKKYYYLFRVLNQQRVLSHLTDVYEAELINDGGYNYAIFNVLFESELKQEVFSKTDREFKKIFQLQPNLSQLALDTSGVLFTDSAAAQVDNLSIGSADDLIWDKTFKIRLTSKKTGRKIDLNITYNLSSE